MSSKKEAEKPTQDYGAISQQVTMSYIQSKLGQAQIEIANLKGELVALQAQVRDLSSE